MQLFLKKLSGMANIIVHDQAPSRAVCLGLHCLHMPFCQNFGVQNIRTFTVSEFSVFPYGFQNFQYTSKIDHKYDLNKQKKKKNKK